MLEFEQKTAHSALDEIRKIKTGDAKMDATIGSLLTNAENLIGTAVDLTEYALFLNAQDTPAKDAAKTPRKRGPNKKKKGAPKDVSETPDPSLQTGGELGIKDLENAGRD